MPGPGVVAGPSRGEEAEETKPTMTRMTRPSSAGDPDPRARAARLLGLELFEGTGRRRRRRRGGPGGPPRVGVGRIGWAAVAVSRHRRRPPFPLLPRRLRATAGGTVRASALVQEALPAPRPSPRRSRSGQPDPGSAPAVDRLQDRRDVRSDGRDERGRGRDAGHRHGRRAVPLPGAPAGEELVEHDAQAVDVGRLGRLLAERLLGAEVVDRAERRRRAASGGRPPRRGRSRSR